MAKQDKVRVSPDGQGMFFKLPNDFNKGLWLEHFKHLGQHVQSHGANQQRLGEQMRCFPWDVGDLLLEGEQGRVPMKEMKHLCDWHLPNYKWKTLRNWKVTARAIESSRRRDGREGRVYLDFSLHQVVEKNLPEVQEWLLQLAVDEKFTVQQLKDEIKLRSRTHEHRGERLKAKESGWVTLNVKVTKQNHDTLRWIALAYGVHIKKARRGKVDGHGTPDADPALMLFKLAFDYVQEHKAEIKAKVDKEKWMRTETGALGTGLYETPADPNFDMATTTSSPVEK